MKTQLTKIALFSICLSALSLYSCKPKKSLQKTEKAVEVIDIPFADKDHRTNKDNFRASSSGKSADMATSKKIALMNAKNEMASLISATMKRVTDQYTNQVTVGNKQDLEIKFEELQREVVNQQLVDVKILGEKVLKQPDGSFEYWICVEMSKDAVINGISNSQNNKLNYDKKKYEDIFNQEMQKIETNGH
jgi:hypothetical protein